MEELLLSWIEMEVIIRGNRFLNDLSLNEMIICNTLLTNKQITAATLCNRTKLLKSQMNRLLNNMEERNLIIRTPSLKDKRKITIALTEDGLKLYNQEHQQILKIVNKVTDKLGMEKSIQLSDLMMEAIKAINEGE